MPETDIEVKTLHNTDSTSTPTPSANEGQTEAAPVVPDTSFLVAETVTDTLPADTVAEWVPRRKTQRIDTCYISAFDFPPAAMDTAYLDSCLREETVSAPSALVEPPHIPVSAEELAFDSIFAKLTNVADTTFVPDSRHQISIKKEYPGFEGLPFQQSLQHQLWFLPLVFILFFCYGMLLALRSKSLSSDYKEFFSHHAKHAVPTNPGEKKARYRFVANTLAGVSIALFMLQTHLWFRPDSPPHSFGGAVLISLGLMFAYAVFKVASSAYLGYIFFNSETRHEWSRAFWFLFSSLGIVLFPVDLCIAFGPTKLTHLFVYFGLGVAIIAEVLLISYDIRRFFKDKFSILYLFLYLCTLEITPLAALLLGFGNAIATT